jgi:hypothetical protein
MNLRGIVRGHVGAHLPVSSGEFHGDFLDYDVESSCERSVRYPIRLQGGFFDHTLNSTLIPSMLCKQAYNAL